MPTFKGKRSVRFDDEEGKKRDTRRQRNRLWIFSASILVNATAAITPPMLLDVDNGLPGIELWFGTQADHEVGFICHMDTCAAMNTGNLLVHKWLMTRHPHLVA